MFKDGHGRYVLAPAGTAVVEQVLSVELLLDAALAPGGDYYLGFLSAMVSHRLTDESIWEVYAAVRPNRFVGGQRELAGRPLHLIRVVTERKWIGVEDVSVQGRMSYRRSTLERTLLDAVDRPDVCGGIELIVRAWERASREDRIDEDLLTSLALTIGGLVGYRAAYWLHRVGREDASEALIEGLGGPARSGSARLDPGSEFGDGDFPRDRRTGLRVNVPEHYIRGWLSYGK
ncbi:MAG TPA: hypothetical protein VNT32_07030 [Thermoleophilaceae bacterium]|nr:hypothetical protein [Thermoleophilaceae bacterium]